MLVVDFLRVIIGVVILGAGILKLREGRVELRKSILGFRLLPKALVTYVTAALPLFEVAIGIGVVANLSRYWVIAGVGVLGVYTLAISAALARGLTNDCGCFGGVLRQEASPTLIVRNVVLMGMLLPALIVPTAGLTVSLVDTALVVAAALGSVWRLATKPAPQSDHVHSHSNQQQVLEAQTN